MQEIIIGEMHDHVTQSFATVEIIILQERILGKFCLRWLNFQQNFTYFINIYLILFRSMNFHLILN